MIISEAKQEFTQHGPAPLKVGDVVVLASGGPVATIVELVDYDDEPDEVEVIWWDGDEYRRQWFPLAGLRPVPGHVVLDK